MPGYPAGTTLTRAADGLYWSADGKLWLSPEFVGANGDLTSPEATKSRYYYIDDRGAIQPATWTGAKVDDERKAYRNVFFSEDAAAAEAKARGVSVTKGDGTVVKVEVAVGLVK